MRSAGHDFDAFIQRDHDRFPDTRTVRISGLGPFGAFYPCDPTVAHMIPFLRKHLG